MIQDARLSKNTSDSKASDIESCEYLRKSRVYTGLWLDLWPHGPHVQQIVQMFTKSNEGGNLAFNV